MPSYVTSLPRDTAVTDWTLGDYFLPSISVLTNTNNHAFLFVDADSLQVKLRFYESIHL